MSTIAVGLLLGADFWKEKKYSSWSHKEIFKMLEDSPWARKAYVKMKVTGGMGPPGGGGGMGFPGGGGGMGSPSGMGGMGPPGGMGAPPEMQVILRWHSALPIKQAIARLRYKDKVETSEEAAKVLDREESAYIVGIIGMPGPAAFYQPDTLKSGAQLRIENLPPIQAVQILTDQEVGKTNFYLVFPKLEDGAHRIRLEDKNVEFFLKTDSIEIKRKFMLKDMVYFGNLEL